MAKRLYIVSYVRVESNGNIINRIVSSDREEDAIKMVQSDIVFWDTMNGIDYEIDTSNETVESILAYPSQNRVFTFKDLKHNTHQYTIEDYVI